mgnify:CR=1 FL=1
MFRRGTSSQFGDDVALLSSIGLVSIYYIMKIYDTMKFKNLYKALIIDPERAERMKHSNIHPTPREAVQGFEILYLASDFENAFEQAKYVGRYRAAELDTYCTHKCKDVKILNVELVTTGVLLTE